MSVLLLLVSLALQGPVDTPLSPPFGGRGWYYSIAQPFGVASPQRGGRHHSGVDVAAPCGTPVLAAADGELLPARTSGDPDGRGGYEVVLRVTRPGGDLYLQYAHLLSRRTAPGPIRRGELLGTSGPGGLEQHCHLHLSARRGSAPAHGYTARPPTTEGYVDPLQLIPP